MSDESASGKFYGKYRGTVIDNKKDDKNRGRLLVQVPEVLGTKKVLAEACVPFAGKSVGFFMLPEPGTMVWVEFESGDPNIPIWSGCTWAEGDLTSSEAQPQLKFIKTQKFSMIIDEQNGEVNLTYGDDTSMKITSLDVTIKAQTITVEGANGHKLEIDGVSARVNQSSLEVL